MLMLSPDVLGRCTVLPGIGAHHGKRGLEWEEWDLIYSQFVKGFIYMAPGKRKLCKLFTRLQTNEQDKQW